MIIKHKPKNYWNKEMCTKEALKYNGRYEFQKNSMSAYRSAIVNGWLDEVCSHMVISEIYLKTQKNNER